VRREISLQGRRLKFPILDFFREFSLQAVIAKPCLQSRQVHCPKATNLRR